jgi:hypothetical protein
MSSSLVIALTVIGRAGHVAAGSITAVPETSRRWVARDGSVIVEPSA